MNTLFPNYFLQAKIIETKNDEENFKFSGRTYSCVTLNYRNKNGENWHICRFEDHKVRKSEYNRQYV